MGLEEVSGVLWKERELLELLLFKLEEEQLVLAGGRSRWLPHATREVEVLLTAIREAELVRAAAVDAAAAELGLPPGPSLRALAAAAPPPWSELLVSHREAFLKLTTEIGSVTAANRDLLTAGRRATRDTLLGLGDDAGTYSPTGRDSAPARAHLVDEAI